MRLSPPVVEPLSHSFTVSSKSYLLITEQCINDGNVSKSGITVGYLLKMYVKIVLFCELGENLLLRTSAAQASPAVKLLPATVL